MVNGGYMSKIKFDALIVGPLAGCDYILAEHLSRLGLRICVVRKEKYENSYIPPDGFFRAFDPASVVFYKRPLQLLGTIYSSRIILSFTGSFLGIAGPVWPLRKLLRLPPVININTGADIEELAISNGLYASLYRYFLRTVDFNWAVNYPLALKNIIKLKLPNVHLLRFPYITDIEFPSDVSLPDEDDCLKIFHPSSFDWGVNDSYPEKTHKGNDVFLKGIISALDQGLSAECLVLDRGYDRCEAREIIESSGHADRFIWADHLERDALFRKMAESDIIVDQFSCGGIGGILIEAMALGKPVLTYINEYSNSLTYPEMPPVLNARTPEAVADILLKYSDRKKLESLGRKAQDWVGEYHDPATYLNKFLFHYSRLTGVDVR